MVTRAVGIFGAAVCFVNHDSGNGYVFNTSMERIPGRDIELAMNSIGARFSGPNSGYIAYTHPGESNDNYWSAIEMFAEWDIPDDHIVEIANLPIAMFGLNNHLQVGY